MFTKFTFYFQYLSSEILIQNIFCRNLEKIAKNDNFLDGTYTIRKLFASWVTHECLQDVSVLVDDHK